MDKTFIYFSPNISREAKEEVMKELDMEHVNGIEKFLGCQLHSKTKKRFTWDSLRRELKFVYFLLESDNCP